MGHGDRAKIVCTPAGAGFLDLPRGGPEGGPDLSEIALSANRQCAGLNSTNETRGMWLADQWGAGDGAARPIGGHGWSS